VPALPDSEKHRRRPIFAIASWVLPGVAALVTTFFVKRAERINAGWLPGLDEAIAGAFIMSVLAFVLGLTAVLRRERHAWIGVLPLLAGLGTLICFAVAFFRH